MTRALGSARSGRANVRSVAARVSPIVGVGALCCASAVGVAADAEAQNAEEVARDLTAIEGDAQNLTRQPLRRGRLRSRTHVEERLTDGELFYRLQDYIRASIIFTDIVDNYPRHRAYPDALFLLADSLFQAGDYLGARAKFRVVIDRAGEPAFRPYVQRALGRLIEIAIHIRDFEGVEEHFQRLSRLPPTEVEATTAYFRAKYLYNKAVPVDEVMRDGDDAAAMPEVDSSTLEESRRAFEAVPQGSPYYPQARYFIGVIHTLRGELPQAIEAFRRVLRGKGETLEHRKVAHLTRVALGRLYYETNQLDQAIEAYQSVPRTSEHFDTALYEIAWVYIRLGDATRAERALEVLSVAAPSSKYIPDGKLLRGNLLLRNGRLDAANKVFRSVRTEFGPVYRELEEVREQHEDLLGYFRGLVRENLDTFDAASIVPPSAQKWTTPGSDFDRAMSALSDLSQSRQLVAETSDLIVRLNAAIGSPNRVSVFPDLRSQRERTTAIRNRLARAQRALIRIEESNSSGESGELREVRAQRRRIERSLGRMPTDNDDFIIRDDQLLSRYRRLRRDLSALEVELLGIEARIVATDTFVGATANEQQNAEAVTSELGQHRDAVARYREQIAELERLIEIGRIQVGVGDARYRRDDRLRNEYTQLLERERRLSGGRRPETDRLFGKIVRVESMLDRRDAQIERVVEERVNEMKRVIDEESQKLTGYQESLAALEGETEEVVGAVAYASFGEIRDRFYSLVLRADVGRIDVTWARREEHRTRVDMLTRERSRELQALDDEFRDIMDEQPAGEEEEGGDQ